MNKINFSLGLLFFGLLCGSNIYPIKFEKFWAEFIASGCGSPAFNRRVVKDFPTFFAEFLESNSGSASFSRRNVRDLDTFYAEFLTSQSQSAAFNRTNVN